MDYKNGKIYSIRSYQTDDVYIGSTCSPLSKRLWGHKNDYKQYLNDKTNYTSSFEIIKFDDNYIELIELFPCGSKDELHKREGEIIRQTDNCVNKRIAGRSQKEYELDNRDKILEKQKIYRENNRDKILEYYENNKDKFKEKNKNYYETNKNKILEKEKEYYQTNKDKILENHKIKIKCDICNIEICKGSLRRHEQSLKHIKNVE